MLGGQAQSAFGIGIGRGIGVGVVDGGVQPPQRTIHGALDVPHRGQIQPSDAGIDRRSLEFDDVVEDPVLNGVVLMSIFV